MLPFESYSPTRLIMSPEAQLQSGAQIVQHGGSRVLIHFGGGSVIRSGLLETVRASLTDSGLSFVELGGVKPNPRAALVYEGIELCKREKIDYVLAVGGGSVLDSAKAIAIGACYEGDFWDLFGRGITPKQRLGLGTIITLPATGSEASNSSVIKNDELDIKRGLRSDLNRPDFSLINPKLTYTLSPWQIACGASDIMSHVMERYFTPTEGVGLTDRLCEAVLKTVIDETPAALADRKQYDVQANLFWSSTVAHIGWLGMGRAEDWSAHALEHELSGHYDTAHGAGLAALYPAWLTHILAKDDKTAIRISQFSERVLGVPLDFADPRKTAEAGIQRLSQIYRSWGLPANLEELGIPHEDLPRLAKLAKKRPDGFAGSFCPLNEADFLAIYELAWNWQ
ncbi:MAG: iron-containing alcohol dehydrogenase [Clostridiaceae bacterium]|nr:iron-containing alcohol dehydrogenase [Clostridiaceae bacterium]